jgi:hypothetical protein
VLRELRLEFKGDGEPAGSDRFRQFKNRLMRLSDLRKDGPAGVVLAVEGGGDVVTALRMIGNAAGDLHRHRLVVVPQPGHLEFRQHEIAVRSQSRSLGGKGVVGECLDPQSGQLLVGLERQDIGFLSGRIAGRLVAAVILLRKLRSALNLEIGRFENFPSGSRGFVPLGVGGDPGGDSVIETFLGGGDFRAEPGQLLFVGGGRDGDAGLAPSDRSLLHVGEEGGHAVEVALRERIVLVIVALRAAHRRAEPDAGDIPHAVGGVLRGVLLGLGSPFLGGLQKPVVARCDLLPDRRRRQQVARQLLDRELVERLVFIERLDHVIAVGNDVARVVAVVAGGVGKPDQIEPIERHPFAVVRRFEHPFDQLFVGIGTGVADEHVDLIGSRRQSRQIEREPPDQRDAIRLRRRLQPGRLQPGENEPVDLIAGESRLHDRGDRRPDRLDEGPVSLPLRPLFDPLLQDGDVARRELPPRIDRRHLVVRISRRHPLDELALTGLGGDNRRLLRPLAEQPGFGVQPQFGLALVGVGAVAGVTVLGQDRPDIAVEFNDGGDRSVGTKCDGMRQKADQPGNEERDTAAIHRGDSKTVTTNSADMMTATAAVRQFGATTSLGRSLF